MSDNLLMDAADALVAAIRYEVGMRFPGMMEVAWQDDPYFELENAPAHPAVWVVDLGEVRETDRQSITVAEFVLAVIVRQKVAPGDGQANECRGLNAILSNLADFIRNRELVIGANSAVCFKTDRNPARNLEFYHNDGVYLAEITTHWRMVTDDDE